MMRLVLCFFILAIWTTSCVSHFGFGNEIARQLNNSSNNVPPKSLNKPGACYGKCTVPVNFITHQRELFLFTGNPNNTLVALKEIEIVTASGGSTWVKKKSGRDCKSSNPDDCLVWCLVEVPEEKETYITVVDTSATKEYKQTTVEYQELLPHSQEQEWREVVCDTKITKEMIMQIQNFLFAEGLYLEPINGMFTNQTQEALWQYQTENGLPSGQLDLETMDKMGVRY